MNFSFTAASIACNACAYKVLRWELLLFHAVFRQDFFKNCRKGNLEASILINFRSLNFRKVAACVTSSIHV
jgi:hypothetical protein